MEGVQKSSRVFITDKHPGHYRPDEACEIIGMEMVWPQGGYDPRLCYRVRYRDGYEDFIAIERSSYKIKTEEDMIETFMDRLLKEKSELRARLDKLNAFLAGDKFGSLDAIQQGLLEIQASAMATYLHCLDKRIMFHQSKTEPA